MKFFIRYAFIFVFFTIPVLGTYSRSYRFTTFTGEPAVHDLMLHSSEIRQRVSKVGYMADPKEQQRLSQLDFIARNINVDGLPVQEAFTKWADINKFNPNDPRSVAHAAQRVIRFNRFGHAQAYLNSH